MIWVRGHPEQQSKDPTSWNIHQVHSHAVDQAANQAATGPTVRNLPSIPFQLLDLCPGPTWCSPLPTSAGQLYTILGPLRPTLRSNLSLKSLNIYLDHRVSTGHRLGQLQHHPYSFDPYSFDLTLAQLHLPSIKSTWGRLGPRARAHFTKKSLVRLSS